MNGSSSSDQGSNAGAIPIENANKNSTTSEKQKESDGQEESLRVIGHMRISDSEMTYVSATHWAAIRENVRMFLVTSFPPCSSHSNIFLRGSDNKHSRVHRGRRWAT